MGEEIFGPDTGDKSNKECVEDNNQAENSCAQPHHGREVKQGEDIQGESRNYPQSNTHDQSIGGKGLLSNGDNQSTAKKQGVIDCTSEDIQKKGDKEASSENAHIRGNNKNRGDAQLPNDNNNKQAKG